MIYVVEYLSKALKAARGNKKLSQRGLSKATGITQAQISKIENAAVDMNATSLIGLARALDMEVMLIPRQHVPAVSSLIGREGESTRASSLPGPAYALDDEDNDG